MKQKLRFPQLAHARQSDGALSYDFGLMERGRDCYVYAFLPERSVFRNTPRTLLYVLVVYLILLAALSAARRKMDQRYHREQIQTQMTHAKAGITMRRDARSDPIEQPYVYGSPLHLRQILLNIYTNCINYNRIGGSITTRFQSLGGKDQTVTYRWTISDTGIGMSEAFLQHIFDPFAQEHAFDRKGSGLGMTIVRSLVEQMHGSIEIQSTVGVGSTFVLTLPFAVADRAAAVPPAPDPTASLHGLHLLLVDDNDLNAAFVRILLTDEGASVTIVTDGQEAVDAFQDNPPGTFDAILMDLMMPVMDGLTATRTIRAMDRQDAKTIPILAMTANAFEEDAQQCFAAGMNAHLAKPLQLKKVKQAILDHVKPKPTEL